ncbi:putative mediator of RNA polymerase II transcription subunit 19b [Capsicum annuum]|nr:putative mediator of RNA polymerase II transcription subunit 19b [Capsicum annuum]KAF3660710.1 putative mediator of RNA polymerase II transcription subunit 19b [Capsicum annuum]
MVHYHIASRKSYNCWHFKRRTLKFVCLQILPASTFEALGNSAICATSIFFDHLSKVIAAYLLAVLGGNTSPADKDLKKILATGNAYKCLAKIFNPCGHWILPHHELFCKKPLPLSIFNTHYLHNVVGDTEIRKGKGMQLDLHASSLKETNLCIQPFDLDALREAF